MFNTAFDQPSTPSCSVIRSDKKQSANKQKSKKREMSEATTHTHPELCTFACSKARTTGRPNQHSKGRQTRIVPARTNRFQQWKLGPWHDGC